MIQDDIDEALHALEFGPTIPDGQGKVARARAALNALRAEVSRLGRQCDDLTAGFVEKQAEITSLRAEVARHADDLRMVIEQREAMRGEVESLRVSRDKLEDALRDALVAVERLQAKAALADEAAEIMQMAASIPPRDPVHHERVAALGNEIGFGALMSCATLAWRERLIERNPPAGGEFVAGPCRETVNDWLARYDAAPKEKTDG